MCWTGPPDAASLVVDGSGGGESCTSSVGGTSVSKLAPSSLSGEPQAAGVVATMSAISTFHVRIVAPSPSETPYGSVRPRCT